jgi:hypothetical protein
MCQDLDSSTASSSSSLSVDTIAAKTKQRLLGIIWWKLRIAVASLDSIVQHTFDHDSFPRRIHITSPTLLQSTFASHITAYTRSP